MTFERHKSEGALPGRETMLAPLETASDILLAARTRLSDLFAPTESWIRASLKREPILECHQVLQNLSEGNC